MKKNNIDTLRSFTLLCTLTFGAFSQPVLSAPVTPAGQDKLHIQTDAPKKNGETLFSYTVTWRIDGGLTYRSTGLTFLHGPDMATATAAKDVPDKVVIALNDAMEYLYPSWRGTLVEQVGDKNEVMLSNKQGFDFTELTFRDYSNQKLTYDLVGKSFSAADVGIAIDIVYAADVENIADFAPNKPKSASGGFVEVSIDGGEPVSVKTDGKSNSQIEQELARALAGKAQFSSTPIFPNIKDETTRNYKPFDGGEVQLLNLNAKSITIDINDPSLGVLTKFNFPDVNKPVDVAHKLPYVIGTGVVVAIGLFVYFMFFKERKEEEDSSA